MIFLLRKNIDFTNIYIVLSKVQNYNDFAIEKFFSHDISFKIILSKTIIRLKDDSFRRDLFI